MKIARVRFATYRIPFRTPYTTSLGSQTHREGLLLQLEDADGRIGLGEAAPVPDLAIPATALADAFAIRAPLLLGRDVEELASSQPPRSHPDEAAAALDCAVDIAVCDLLAQQRGVSVARLLRADAAASVDVNALVTKPDILDATLAATAARREGYRAVKLKVGMESSPGDEAARIASVRKALGPGVRLRLDPNGAWDIATAIEVLGVVSPLDIEYVEQPLPPGSLDSMRFVQQHLMTPIAADEDVTGFEAVLRIIEMRAARVLILKPQRLGGLRACREIIELARDARLPCVVTTSIEAGIGVAACLHLSAALLPGSPACGLSTAGLLASGLTTETIAVENGAMLVPTAPGLGVTLDTAALETYAGPWQELS